MGKRITIKDVAEGSGVSISTVHLALNGKKGVSDTTRKKVTQVAAELGYQPNSMASSLKRKTRYIAILLPSRTGSNRLYYPPAWQGIHDYFATVIDMNISCIELPYTKKDIQDPSTMMGRIRHLVEENRLDGLLTVGHVELFGPREWKYIREANVAVSLINSDSPGSARLCVAQPNYDVIGRTMAELILSHIPEYGSIFMCCGNPEWDAHALVVKGFESYMSENNARNRIYRDHSYDMSQKSYRGILKALSCPDIAACCSVLSQSSVLLARALEESGKAQKVFAVGSDLSKENAAALQSGVFDNLIQKNPYAQGYTAAKVLTEYLAQGKLPEREIYYVGSEVVFKSNLQMYSPDHKLMLM